MALPSSGQITLDQIRTELGSTSGDLRVLSQAAGFSTPDQFSDFYGYSAVTYTEIELEVFDDFGMLCAGEPGERTTVYSQAFSSITRADTLYADTSGTLYDGRNKYHKNSSGNGHIVDERGVVGSEEFCG